MNPLSHLLKYVSEKKKKIDHVSFIFFSSEISCILNTEDQSRSIQFIFILVYFVSILIYKGW